MNQGILYICADDEYLTEAKASAESVQKRMSDIPTAIITDAEYPGTMFDITIELNNPHQSVVDKAENIHRTPFQKTLYLDTDTYLAESVYEIFEMLDYCDFATALEKGDLFDVGLPSAIPYRQGGVIAYQDNSRVMELFELWRNIYASAREQGHINDQPPLTKAAIESSATVQTLPVEYNCLIYYGERLEGPAKIIHGHSPEEVKQAANKINETHRHRVFTSLFDNNIKYVDEKSLSLVELLYISLKLDGVSTTAQRILKRMSGRS